MLAYDYAVIAYYYQRMFNLYHLKLEVAVQKEIIFLLRTTFFFFLLNPHTDL